MTVSSDHKSAQNLPEDIKPLLFFLKQVDMIYGIFYEEQTQQLDTITAKCLSFFFKSEVMLLWRCSDSSA